MSYEKFNIDEVSNRIGGPISLFICCASYESRCESVATRISVENVQHALVVENKNHADFHGGSAQKLLRIFDGKSELVALNTTDPLLTADNLKAALAPIQDDPSAKIVVDITTFTRESLLILLALLRRKFKRAKVVLAYVNAAEYSINEPDDKKWLSRGIAEVRSVLGFAGNILPSRRLHLIVLVGFEYDRAAELIRAFEPSIVSLGYDDSAEPSAVRHRKAQEHNLERIRALYSNAHEFKFSGYDPLSAKAAVEKQAKAFPDANAVIAPMNTKLSTVGTALAAMDNEELQLCYVQAAHYNYQHYSTPGTWCYLFEF